jgi:hypothetical protein
VVGSVGALLLACTRFFPPSNTFQKKLATDFTNSSN